MATSTGVKEYTLRINGVDTSIKDITKLEAAIAKLDGAVAAANASTVNAGKASAARGKAVTDEEKAAQRLASTQQRLAQVNTEANRAQIAANIALREATREATRSIQINQLAEGSIKQMGMQLTDLRNEYEALSAEQRASDEIGGQLLQRIQALDAEYKALRESTGNFRDSVGNYGRAIEGIESLSTHIEGASKTTMGLANTLILSNGLMGMFGAESAESAETMRKLQQVIMLVSLAQSVNNDLFKDGAKWLRTLTAATNVQTAATEARTVAETASTKSTWAARAAQIAFNIVASANPYVLLALAIVAVGAALFAFATRTDDAADKQDRLNKLQAAWLDMLDREAGKLKTVGDARIKQLERALELLEATGATQGEIQAAEARLAAERAANNARLRGFYAQEIADLGKNRKAVAELEQAIDKLNAAKATGARLDYVTAGDLTLDASDADKALEVLQREVDNLNRQIEIAVTINADAEDLAHQTEVWKAEQDRANKDLAKQAADAAKQRAAIELQAVRDAQDARTRLILSSYEREYRTISAAYDRQIEDLRIRLATEEQLTSKARTAIADNVAALEAERARQLDDLRTEYTRREIATIREAEDARTALVLGGLERQRVEIQTSYDRQIEDLRTRLDTELDLTEAQQAAITDMIVSAEKQRGRELEAVTLTDMERRTTLQVRAAEAALAAVRDAVGEVTVTDVTSGLIDVDATQANAERINGALSEYVEGLRGYMVELTATHQQTAALLDENSVEYAEAAQGYAEAMGDATRRIRAALKEQQDNTREATAAQAEYWKGLFDRIAEYAQAGADAVTAVTDTWAAGLQITIDNLNAQLDAVNERYEDAQARREAAAASVEQAEERMRNASGATSDALRIQLQDAMAARNEAAREEQRLEKEKAKREAEIAKREKQMKRAELVGGIAMGIANTAQAVTKMLTLVWPLNLIMAAVVGAAGGVQVGLMSRQLAKLADGGPIEGPSHAGGGVNINVGGKPSYEAEGGEFMVNKYSTAANGPLIRYINDAAGPVSLADIAGLVPDGSTVDASGNLAPTDPVVEAIDAIELRPIVQVVDIMDVTATVTEVQDLSGFS